MNPDEFVERLLKAIEVASQEHKNAQAQPEYLYTQGRLDALREVFDWIEDAIKQTDLR